MNQKQAETLAEKIRTWSLPYVSAYVSTLGGEERASVMVTVSLDKREAWSNGILENSRYAKLAFHSANQGISFSHHAGHGVRKIRAWMSKSVLELKPGFPLEKKLSMMEDFLKALV